MVGWLTTQSGKQIGYYSSGASYLYAGIQELPMYFDGQAIGLGGANGPYKLKDFVLTQISNGNVMVANLPLAYSTAAYSRYDWFRPTIILSDAATEQALDTNNNTLYDKLRVTVHLDL